MCIKNSKKLLKLKADREYDEKLAKSLLQVETQFNRASKFDPGRRKALQEKVQKLKQRRMKAFAKVNKLRLEEATLQAVKD